MWLIYELYKRLFLLSTYHQPHLFYSAIDTLYVYSAIKSVLLPYGSSFILITICVKRPSDYREQHKTEVFHLWDETTTTTRHCNG